VVGMDWWTAWDSKLKDHLRNNNLLNLSIYSKGDKWQKCNSLARVWHTETFRSRSVLRMDNGTMFRGPLRALLANGARLSLSGARHKS
jgi:hypothetical protein